jgi:hypothetical protein
VLLLALPVLVAAPVGGVPGTRHVVWQDAACELHAIMQFVTVEVCASRTLPAANAFECQIASATVAATNRRAPPTTVACFAIIL